MKIQKIIYTVLLLSLFIGCSKKQVEVTSGMKTIKNVVVHNDLDVIVPKLKVHKHENNLVDELNLSNNEKEFLDILEADSYASLCDSNKKYLRLKNMPSDDIKKMQLKDLFYDYVNNLNNSCINQKAFNKILKRKKYKKNKQFYEMYNDKINKKSLLKLYTSETVTIKNILKKYTPKHPNFFKFIKALDKNNLSKLKYNTLRLNIERLKLLKNYNSSNFIQLNIPSYNFSFFENGNKIKSFGTVVGSKSDQTPVLSSKLSYFIVNPTWNIPDSIAKSTIIPKALKDKNYLKKKNIVIRKNYKLTSKKFKFKDIKWNKYLKKNVKYIPYKFIQLPSNTNGMGRVKFMFKNNYAVYMHDTMGTWRFKIAKERIRFVSHGCIRLEHPLAFMKHVTTKYTKKSYQSVRKIYNKEETKSISLSKRLPLHITYMTAYMKNGKVGFYKDVYSYDKIQKLNFTPYLNKIARIKSLTKKANKLKG
jgi:hypothetical protein